MKFLREPSHRGWVAVNGTIKDEVDLRSRLLSVDVCLSDLDDTDAKSPARYIALRDSGQRFFKEWDYTKWLTRTVWNYLLDGKGAQQRCWEDYTHLFLKSPCDLASLRADLSEREMNDLVFPGVDDFYNLITSPKLYVTQNVMYLAMHFKERFSFSGVFSGVENKSGLVEDFIKEFPHFRRYLVKGNTERDEGMVAILRYYKERGVIDEVVSCYVAESSEPGSLNPRFDINIGRDYTGLVDILKHIKK